MVEQLLYYGITVEKRACLIMFAFPLTQGLTELGTSSGYGACGVLPSTSQCYMKFGDVVKLTTHVMTHAMMFLLTDAGLTLEA